MICVLLSGGLDSTLALVRAAETGQSVAAVTYRYGQLHEREVDAARDVADLLDVEHHVFSLGDTLCVPDQPGAVVPCRNLTMIAGAAGWVHVHGGGEVHIGACREDYEDYPDCRPDFFRLASATLALSGADVRVVAPWANTTKRQAVELVGHSALGRRALALSYSCYLGGERPCGVCPACVKRRAALAQGEVPCS